MSEARDRYNQLFAWYKPEENPDAPNWIKVVYNRISELEQQNKYLTEQNKAFQEEYNTSGDIIRELRQQNKELIASFDDFIREINSLCYKSQSPLMNNSHQIDTKYLRKRCLNLHSSLNKHR